MYLEIVFALGTGLLLYAIDRDSPRAAALLVAAQVLIVYAIALSFTRAGTISVAVVLAFVLWRRVRSRGFDRGAALVVAVAVAAAGMFLTSRSLGVLWLRFTTEGQDAWYRARFVVPSDLTLRTGALAKLRVTVTNTGKLAWDSEAADAPFFLSYHWLEPDGERYIVFEGLRTWFDAPVEPGATVTLTADVRAPRQPGSYQLAWDLVQEHRLWFGSEPGAATAISRVRVEGEAAAGAQALQPPRARNIRPGRLVLWRAAARMVAAHPLLGVGPDNFRLIYPQFAGLSGADPRVHSNNMYIEILAGAGLAGGLAFGWLLWRAAVVFARACAAMPFDPIPTAAAAAGLAILSHGFLDSFLAFAPTYVLFALIVGLAAASGRGTEVAADARRV
jgi:O-antigen ligase